MSNRDYYQKNKENIKKKSLDYYYKHREERLRYLKGRKEKDRILKNKRRWKDIEKSRNKESLYAHKVAKKLAKKRKIEQHEKYLNYQENSISPFRYQKWTIGEIEYLKKNYRKSTILDMAIIIGRTWGATSRKLNKLRFLKQPFRIRKLCPD